MGRTQQIAGASRLPHTKRARPSARSGKGHDGAAQNRKGKHLIVSFWDIGLDNLPEGLFSHRRITGEEAKSLVIQARKDNQLLCVSKDDLLAPYCKDEAQSHQQLCAALGEHVGIEFSIRDFTSSFEDKGETLYSIIPLQAVQIGPEDQFMVVSCDYSVDKEKGESFLNPGIAPDSIAFHLFETAKNLQSENQMRAGRRIMHKRRAVLRELAR